MKVRNMKEQQVTARVDARVKSLMITVATKEGITISDLLNEVLKRWYDETLEGLRMEKEEPMTAKQEKYLKSLWQKNNIDPPKEYKKMTKHDAWLCINDLVDREKE